MLEAPYPPTRRIVTGHNDETKAVIERDNLIAGKQTGHGPFITLLWSSAQLPANLNITEDMGLAQTGLSNNGSIVRIVDFPPISVGMVHRSITLDYIYVLKGEIVLTLDNGSRTVMKEGEACIQRATMHSWDNETEEWARLLCILLKAEAPTVNGKTMVAEVPFQV